MAKNLHLNIKNVQDATGNIDETPVKVLDQKELEVFNAASPRPANAVMGDAAVTQLLNTY
jgi:hypothetical protein